MPSTAYGTACARYFAQLVWLLREEPSNIADQKMALRMLVAEMQHGHVMLAERGGQLSANDIPADDLSACAHTLLTQLAAHGFDAIAIAERTPPKALLDVARHLASTPLDDALEGRFNAWPVCLIRRGPTESTPALHSLDGMSLTELEPAPVRAPVEVPTPVPLRVRQGSVEDADFSGSMFEHFATRSRVTNGQLEDLLRRLDAPSDHQRIDTVLGRLAVQVEEAVARGEIDLALLILGRISDRELRLEHGEDNRTLLRTIRRLARGRLVRAVASRLPGATTTDATQLIAILSHAGEEGADAVIEQLVEATDRGHRRVYFDTLTHLKSGVSSLVHMLGDAQWFVVRNAAELLGRIGAREAESALCALLTHDDERVRASAIAALMQLGTPSGQRAVVEALEDQSATVRRFAAGALAIGSPAQMAPPLIRALDRERDEEVQAACVLSLGRLGTAEAMDRVATYAQPSRGLFKRNAPAVRLAAIQALGHAATAKSRAVLLALPAEGDDEIGAAIRAALAARPNGARAASLTAS